jgi:hypothetical protein
MLLSRYRPFASCCSEKDLAEPADGPNTVREVTGAVLFVLFRQPISCRYHRTSDSLQAFRLQNFTGQNLTNELYLSQFVPFVLLWTSFLTERDVTICQHDCQFMLCFFLKHSRLLSDE